MNTLIQGNPWVWVVVQDPEGNEKFLGQRDEAKGESCFSTIILKKESLKCLNLLSKEKGHTYEVQAIQYEDLARRAAENGFMLFVLNGAGEVLEKVN
jgi:hypothetical protein